MNEKAQAYADRFGLAGTVGSDAHTLAEVGTAVLELPPFATAEELRAVIRQGRAITRYSSPMVHFGSSYARIAKHFGWVRRD
jgi:predicted metal-dependent phosphoesterase TrpH